MSRQIDRGLQRAQEVLRSLRDDDYFKVYRNGNEYQVSFKELLTLFGGSAGGSSNLWTPSEINTAIWAEASNPSSRTLVTGTNILASWIDKSGNNRNFYNSNSSLSPNVSSSSISFTNTKYIDASYSLNSSTIYMFAVASHNNTSDDYARLFSLRSSSGFDYDNSNSILLAYFPDNTVKMYRANAILVSTTTFTQNTLSIVEGYRNGEVAGISLNGNAYFTGTTNSAITSSTIVRLGEANQVIAQGLNGNYHECILLDYIPTTNIIQRIQGYLAWKWGLVSSLPSSHVYKTSAPTL